MTSIKADTMNAKFVKYVPELASEYAKYPMSYPRWLDPKEKDNKGRPCFMESQVDAGLKMDYVYGRGKFGRGYYHMMTREAYTSIHPRMRSEAPGGSCSCFSASARKEVDAHDDVKRIMYNRSVASIPNDVVAASDAIEGARQTAKQWHNGLQNEQLMVGFVQHAT
jgi:hypothetical protein